MAIQWLMDCSSEVVTKLSLLDFIAGNILISVQECKVRYNRGSMGTVL
jgi:hypothetical protein